MLSYPNTEISKLVDRITLILEQLTIPDEEEPAIYTDADLDKIDEFNIIPTNGFHALYLKCQIFNILLAPLTHENYSDLTEPEKMLIELLFNPALEGPFVRYFNAENLEELLENFNDVIESAIFAPDIIEIPCREWIVCPDAADYDTYFHGTFDNLRNSAAKYIQWYDANKNALYKSSNLPIKSANDGECKDFLELLKTSAVLDVEQDSVKLDLFSTDRSKGIIAGTRGLGPCMAIICILTNAGQKPDVVITHNSSGFQNNLDYIYEEYHKKYDELTFYLIGGHPCIMDQYLPLIYENKQQYNIADVRLLTCTDASIACVAYCAEDKIRVGYSGDLDHIPSQVINQPQLLQQSPFNNADTFFSNYSKKRKDREDSLDDMPSQKKTRLN